VEVIEADNAARRQLGLRAPTLDEYDLMRGLKTVKNFVYLRILRNHGIVEYTPPTNPKKIEKKVLRRQKRMARKARRQGGQPSVAGHAGLGNDQPYHPARVGFGASHPSLHERGGFGRGFRAVGRSFPPSGGYRYPLLLRSRERLRSIVMSASICLSVCLSVWISPEPRAIFTKFFAHVAHVRGSVLLRHVDDRPHCLWAGRGDGSAQCGHSVVYDCFVVYFI